MASQGSVRKCGRLCSSRPKDVDIRVFFNHSISTSLKRTDLKSGNVFFLAVVPTIHIFFLWSFL